MVFYDINQGKHFIYCHLMHTLMYTCDPMSFKISSILSKEMWYRCKKSKTRHI